MNFKWIDGITLELDELRKIATIDNSIPLDFDPDWVADEVALKKRVEIFQKYTASDFFKVVYDGPEIIAFHDIAGKTPIAHVMTLWVHPNYRGKGIAKSLKEEGVRWAKEKGFTQLQTGVHANNERMHEINQQNGYKVFFTMYRLKL